MLLQKNPVSRATRGDPKPFWNHQEVFALFEAVGQSSGLNGCRAAQPADSAQSPILSTVHHSIQRH